MTGLRRQPALTALALSFLIPVFLPIVLLFFLSTGTATADESKPRLIPHSVLIRELAQDGFENIIAQTSASVTLLSFEDAAYRNSVRGLTQAMRQTIMRLPPSNRRVFLIIQKYGVPVAGFISRDVETVVLPKSQRKVALPRMKVSSQTLKYWQILRRYYPANRSVLRSDLIIHPDMKAVLGNYDNPVALQLNMIPELRMVLFPGGVLSASLIVPLYNELADYGNAVRLGATNLTFFTAVQNSLWFYASAGYFYDERYGAQALIRKVLHDGRWAVDARIGYSGYAVMDHGRFFYDPMDALTWSLETTYFLRQWRLFISGGYHQFVEQDTGLRLDVFRFFSGFRFGVWASSGDQQWNGGFRIALPLPPSRYRPRQLFRLRMADYFRIGYQGRRETNTGTILENSELMDDLLIHSFPSYLESHLNWKQTH